MLRRNTAATWSLWLGIIAVLFAIAGGIGGTVLIAGVWTGIVGLRNARQRDGLGHDKAIAGLILCGIGLVIVAIWVVGGYL
jgi:heme/copper-type cytochrome/quinol oxidase subunit 1